MKQRASTMRRGLSLAAALAVGLVEPASAQSFFERLFRPPPPQQPQLPPQPIPRAQPRAPAQPRRAAPPAASTQPGSPSQPQQQAAPQPEPPPAPYEPDLLRLAEILGSMAFLRSLCGQSDAAEWPGRMQTLLDAEGTTPGRRDRLAGAYNRGYRAFGITYRACTPSANEATSRYLKEGEQLARTLSNRYGS